MFQLHAHTKCSPQALFLSLKPNVKFTGPCSCNFVGTCLPDWAACATTGRTPSTCCSLKQSAMLIYKCNSCADKTQGLGR